VLGWTFENGEVSDSTLKGASNGKAVLGGSSETMLLLKGKSSSIQKASYFRGMIDNFHIYNRGLSDVDMARLSSRGSD
jgi:hypothetical protein